MTNPRGIPTWPDWRTAEVGQRVRHVRTDWTGIVVRVNDAPGNLGFVSVKWDRSGATGRVVAPAFDLEPIEN